MLLELAIRDFAIIDATTIPFEGGFNALTGETGAGKSILIDALGAVLGERVGSDVVRSGAKAARVEATFDVADAIVRPEVAARQFERERSEGDHQPQPRPGPEPEPGPAPGPGPRPGPGPVVPPPPSPVPRPTRYFGTVPLDEARVGRDAGRIAEEVIAHLAGLVGANVRVTLEIAAEIPAGVPDHVVRTVLENGRTLKFTTQGFEQE